MYHLKDDEIEQNKVEELFIIDPDYSEYYCASCLAIMEIECCCDEIL